MCSCQQVWRHEPRRVPTRTACPRASPMQSCAPHLLPAGLQSPRRKALSWALSRCVGHRLSAHVLKRLQLLTLHWAVLLWR